MVADEEDFDDNFSRVYSRSRNRGKNGNAKGGKKAARGKMGPRTTDTFIENGNWGIRL